MASRKSVTEKDLQDLHGKVAIVTGSNQGIGYNTVRMLARQGAKVYMAARNEERATTAIKALEKDGLKDGSVHWLKLDLLDPRNAKAAAKEFMGKETRLDILVNNGAMASGPFKKTKDGLLDVMVTNHISHFALTDALLPLMKSTAKEEGSDVRIVNISSIAHSNVTSVKLDSFVGKETLNRDFGQGFISMLRTYGYSKLANILHMKELQRRLDAENIAITCVSLHPGFVRSTGSSAAVKSMGVLGWVADKITPLVAMTAIAGAVTPAFAAASKDKAGLKGAYLVPVAKIVEPSKYAQDERLAKELWETTEEVLKELEA